MLVVLKRRLRRKPKNLVADRGLKYHERAWDEKKLPISKVRITATLTTT